MMTLVESIAENESKWRYVALCVIAALALWRLVFLQWLPFDLVGDEAYYWDWGRRLSWGYFSKPPLIAWLMRLSGWLMGDTTVGIRSMAAILGTGTLGLLFALGRRLFGSRVGFWALAAFAFCAGNVVQNIVLTIDAPLVFFWTLSLFLFWAFCEAAPRDRWLFGLMLFGSLGLGHLSKQMMLFFPVLGLSFLWFSAGKRSLLKSGWLWFAFLGSLLFLVPPLFWNWKHDWITFQHTAHHFETQPLGLGAWALRWLEFPLSQALLLNPVVFFGLAPVAWWSVKRWPTLSDSLRFVFVFSIPALLVFLLLAMRQKVNANWAAVYYPAAVLLACHWFLEMGKRWRYGLYRAGVGLGLLLAIVVYALPLAVTRLDLAGTHSDPLARLDGWKEFGEAIWQVQRELVEPTTLLCVGHRYNASELAFYHPDQPRVYCWDGTESKDSQYEVWAGPEEAGFAPMLVVVPVTGDSFEIDSLPAALRASYRSVSWVKDLEVRFGGRGVRRFQLYLGEGYGDGGLRVSASNEGRESDEWVD